MKHILYLDNRSHRYEGEIPCTHVVVGRRDPASDDPGKEPHPNAEGFASWHQRRRTFVSNQAHGRYRRKPLEWAESEAEASALVGRFRHDGWLDVVILPISTVDRNG